MTDTRVLGFVGVGRMGGPMASRLLDAGMNSWCSIRTPTPMRRSPRAARGSRRQPAEVASLAPIVLVSLPTPAIVQSVALGERGIIAASTVKTVVDLSTTGPGVAAHRGARRSPGTDITSVDSPVSGGVAGAVKGTLAVMVSCPQTVYAERRADAQELRQDCSSPARSRAWRRPPSSPTTCSPPPRWSSRRKRMAMGVKAGLDPKVLIDIINAGSGRNSATQDKFPRAVLTRHVRLRLRHGLSYKDVRLCVDEAEAMGVPMVVGAAVRQMLAVTQAKFGANSDFTCIARVVEEWAGVEIKSELTIGQ